MNSILKDAVSRGRMSEHQSDGTVALRMTAQHVRVTESQDADSRPLADTPLEELINAANEAVSMAELYEGPEGDKEIYNGAVAVIEAITAELRVRTGTAGASVDVT